MLYQKLLKSRAKCRTMKVKRINFRAGDGQMDWENIADCTMSDYMREADFEVPEAYRTGYLDVSEHISELSYLTHDYFRYYGKFPSKIAKHIIETLDAEGRIRPDSDYIFDNYAGSGTSLVEAKLAGYSSAGVDINPFGVLASKVKTRNYNVLRLYELLEELLGRISADDVRGDMQIYADFPGVEKWYEPETIAQLSSIKRQILSMPRDSYREFFALGFFAVLRRVSRAHDAEVRPHIDPKKKRRDALAAFKKKVGEMIYDMVSWNRVTLEGVDSRASLCDNGERPAVLAVTDAMEGESGKRLGLAVSHPPYLNCFDYVPVYKLEFMWAGGFDEIYGELDHRTVRAKEIRSYPAAKAGLINDYFERNLRASRIVYDCLKPGGYCCMVIGDCTIKQELFPVHKLFIRGLEVLGYDIDRVIYRSTSYGTGRYAYSRRANYTDGPGGKQDVIIFARKPGRTA